MSGMCIPNSVWNLFKYPTKSLGVAKPPAITNLLHLPYTSFITDCIKRWCDRPPADCSVPTQWYRNGNENHQPWNLFKYLAAHTIACSMFISETWGISMILAARITILLLLLIRPLCAKVCSKSLQRAGHRFPLLAFPRHVHRGHRCVSLLAWLGIFRSLPFVALKFISTFGNCLAVSNGFDRLETKMCSSDKVQISMVPLQM